jgi:glutamyl/glutaminyl-tRNA synthetase
LKELADAVPYFFQEELVYDPAAAAKFLKDPDLPDRLEALRDRYARLPRFDKESLEAELRSLAEEQGIKPAVLIHPARMALSAATAGPPLFDLIEVMGREATARRLGRYIGFLRSLAAVAPHSFS